jgi:hypothetical protein
MGRFLFRTATRWEKYGPAIFISIGLFAYLILFREITQPDLRDHIRISNQMFEGTHMPHPVFFLLLQVFSGFSKNSMALLFAAFFLFSLGSFLKIIFSIQLCETILKEKASRLLLIIVLACQAAIGFVWLQDGFVRSSLSPNFFHNGTLILSLPPSLYLLNQSILFLRDEDPKRKGRMILAGFMILLIKPSFLFCWIPVLPVFVLLFHGTSKKLLSILQVAVILIFALVLQSFFLRNSAVGFKLLFSPFTYFGTIPNHLRVFMAAVFFPLVSLLPGWQYWKSKTGILMLMLCFQGLLISFCFYDVIREIISPNMLWQSSIAHYMMLLFAGTVLHELLAKRKYLPAVLPAIALLAQVLSGMQYLRLASIMRSFYF